MTGIIVVLLGLATAAASIRASGEHRYRAVCEAQARAGLGGTPEDLLAMGPPIDAARQEAWWAWQQRARALPDTITCDERVLHAWLVGGGPPPQALVDQLAATAGPMGEARDLLRRGDLVISALGWAGADLASGALAERGLERIRIPSLLTSRLVAEWLHHSALIDLDPLPALADLDALHRALTRSPATLIDAMTGIAIGAIRDRAYLESMLAGRLPRAAATAWQDETVDHLRVVADGFRGERLLFLQLAMRARATDLAASSGPATLPQVAWSWLFTPSDCAQLAGMYAGIEQRLRSPSAPSPGPPPRLSTGSMSVANLIESAFTALHSGSHARCARIAGRILGLVADGAGLPADEAALLAALGDPLLMDPGGDAQRLRYEQLSGSLFRVTVDPGAMVRDLCLPSRIGSAHGQPPSTNGTPPAVPLLLIRRGVQIAIPAR